MTEGQHGFALCGYSGLSADGPIATIACIEYASQSAGRQPLASAFEIGTYTPSEQVTITAALVERLPGRVESPRCSCVKAQS